MPVAAPHSRNNGSTVNPEQNAMGTSRSNIRDERHTTSVGGVTQVVGLRLGEEEYGIDIMRAQEIITVSEITRMPEVPDYIRGLINLRGNVIPIVDLRCRFSLPAKPYDESTRIIVANVREKTVGFVVDAVTGVLRIREEQIDPPPTNITELEHQYVCGLVRLNNKLLILLNIDAVLQGPKLTQIEQGSSQ